jgi:putative flippase GtrA
MNQKPTRSVQSKAPVERQSRLKFLIFSAIGVFNTLVDIAIYIFVYDKSHNLIVANTVATTAGLIGSYILNSKLTFQTKTWTTKTVVSFVVVTVFGLWVLQTGTIELLSHFLTRIPEHYWQVLGPIEKLSKQLVPKLLATAVTLVWNYSWYNKVIFKDDPSVPTGQLALRDL